MRVLISVFSILMFSLALKAVDDRPVSLTERTFRFVQRPFERVGRFVPDFFTEPSEFWLDDDPRLRRACFFVVCCISIGAGLLRYHLPEGALEDAVKPVSHLLFGNPDADCADWLSPLEKNTTAFWADPTSPQEDCFFYQDLALHGNPSHADNDFDYALFECAWLTQAMKSISRHGKDMMNHFYDSGFSFKTFGARTFLMRDHEVDSFRFWFPSELKICERVHACAEIMYGIGGVISREGCRQASAAFWQFWDKAVADICKAPGDVFRGCFQRGA